MLIFLKQDYRQLNQTNFSYGDGGGTTVVIAIIYDQTLIIANVGDSEAILCRGSNAIALSTLHNPAKNYLEGKRVEKVGGIITRSNRVGHPSLNYAYTNIAVSRAIGDITYKYSEFCNSKPSGLIPDPDIHIEQLSLNDQFLILACDGLWDVMRYHEAVNYVQTRLSNGIPIQQICQDLVIDAELVHGSTDNITVCIIFFNAIPN